MHREFIIKYGLIETYMIHTDKYQILEKVYWNNNNFTLFFIVKKIPDDIALFFTCMWTMFLDVLNVYV